MEALKKAGIIAGAIVGGTIGGVVSVVGKVARIDIVDEVGTSIIESSLFTGSVAGEVASSTVDILTGKLSGNQEVWAEGWQDLKTSGKQVAGNFISNAQYILRSSADLTAGIRAKDAAKAVKGVKKLAKLAAVGAITVGAIKLPLKDEEDL